MNENLKDKVVTDKEDVEHPSTIYGDDIRALVLAHILNNSMVNVESNAAIKGQFSYYYRKLEVARKVVLAFIIYIIIFQKPSWCIAKGDTIQANCSQDVQGNTYNLAITSFMDARTSFVMSFSLMYFLIVLQVLKIQASDKVFSSEKTKLVLQIAFFSLSLIIKLMEGFNFIPISDFSNIFNLLFVIVYFKSILQSFKKILVMLKASASVLLLLALNISIFSLLGRVIFEDVRIGSDSFLQGYGFNSIWQSLDSMFKFMCFEYFPDVLAEAHAISPFYTIFFIMYLLSTAVLLLALITGVLYFNYKGIYIQNLNKVANKYPTFITKIDSAMKSVFLKPQIASYLVKNFENKLKHAEVEEISSNQLIRNSYKAKLRRALIKIKYLISFKNTRNSQSPKTRFIAISESFYYKLISLVLAVYACLIPILSLGDDVSLKFIGYLQTSELIGAVFLIDLSLKYAFYSRMNFWGFINICAVISSLGVMVCAYILYLIPADFRDTEIISSRSFYLIWMFCSALNFIRIQKILMDGIKYKIIIKTILHIFPLVIDLISCYAIIIIFYSSVAFSVLGGVLNSEFGVFYENVTGESLPLSFHFNDIINSIISFSTVNISSGFCDIFMPGIVASLEVSQNAFMTFLMAFFFYSYVVITNIIVINIIVGFIIDFLNIYQENNAEKRAKEQIIKKKQNFIDVMLDNKNFGEIDIEEYDLDGDKLEEKELDVQALNTKDKNIDPNQKEDAHSDIQSNEFESEASKIELSP